MAHEKESREDKTSFTERVTIWVGIIGSIVTILLTIWNAHTKSLIDEKEQYLKALEVSLKERVTKIEESKERVDRYKWVLSLFPALNDEDEKKRNFTLSLTRLALTEDEAAKLFANLQASPSKELQLVGQNGYAAIQNEVIALLVTKMNESTSKVRNDALATLKRDYKDSSQAITMTLQSYDPTRIDGLSPQGMINGLLFLNETDPVIWNRLQLETAKQIAKRIEERGPGPQTKKELTLFTELLNRIPAGM